ncbi:MAG: AAA family ATPase [Rhodospirillales bacterium]|nr:AAA family ATPase [Rhodospirillales bacterium]
MAAKKKQNKQSFDRESIRADTNIGKIILALSDEIDLVQDNAKKATLKDGTYVGKVGDYHVYEFLLIQDFDFDENEDVYVEAEGRDVIRGTVSQVSLNTAQISFEDNLGEKIDKITITSSEGAQLAILRSQLKKVHDKEKSINQELADISIGAGTPKTVMSDMPKAVEDCLAAQKKILNPEQKEALQKSVSSQCLLLWGPPGTGKTFALGLMVLGYLSQGKSVLLASNTNKAVDQAFRSVIEAYTTVPSFKEGEKTLLRLGSGITDTIKTDNKIPEWAKKITPEEILEDRQKELQEQYDSLKADHEKTGNRLHALNKKIRVWDDFFATEKKIDDLKTGLAKDAQAIETNNRRLQEITPAIQILKEDFQRAPEGETITTRLGFKKSRPEIAREIQGKEAERENIASQVQTLIDGAKIKETDLRDAKQRHSSLSSQTKALEPYDPLKKAADEVAETLAGIEADMAEIEAKLRNLRKELIEKADLIATTVYGVFSKPEISDRTYDVVIIDEASMVVLPMTYYAAGRAKSQIVIVGDFKQLPAITQAETDLVKEWLFKTPFHKYRIPEALIKGELPECLVGLREQNRMKEEISDLISKKFYKERQLSTGQRAHNAPPLPTPAFSKKGKRIFWIDTSELGAWSAHRYGESSLFNVTHAAIVGAIVDQLIADGILDQKNKAHGLGFVSPYAAQCELVKKLLEDKAEYIDPSSIGTAHKFQGSERDIIIFDYVLTGTKTKTPSRFINAEQSDDQAGCLLNVALSRAKQYLIIIFDSRPFLGRASPFMKSFFKTIMNEGEKLDARMFLDQTEFFEQARKLSVGRVFDVHEPNTLHSEQSFYPALAADLKKATSSIVIFSAFATPDGLYRWFPLFSECLQKGVKIRIVTRTLDNQTGSEANKDELVGLLPLLRQSGIVFEMRPLPHEKVIVIDDEIVWHGSLNMLSQNKSNEVMTRTTSSSFAKEMLSMLARHDLKRANDLLAAQLPVCPDCGSQSELRTGRKGQPFLQCENKCGWNAPKFHFPKLMKGIPMGQKKGKCPQCKTGDLRLNHDWREGYIYSCTNSYGKNKGKCGHKEAVSGAIIQGLTYDPFPAQPAISAVALNGFMEQKGSGKFVTPEPEAKPATQTQPVSEKKKSEPKIKPTPKQEPDTRPAAKTSQPVKQPKSSIPPSKGKKTKLDDLRARVRAKAKKA